MMTIWQYVDNQKPMTCAAWVAKIKADGLEQFESQIMACADMLHLVIINHDASFIKAINK